MISNQTGIVLLILGAFLFYFVWDFINKQRVGKEGAEIISLTKKEVEELYNGPETL